RRPRRAGRARAPARAARRSPARRRPAGDRGASQPGSGDATALQHSWRLARQLRRVGARPRYRLLEPDRDATKALRALSRAREDLVAQRVALANELRRSCSAAGPAAFGW